jgi:hypothetical protein
MSSKIKYHESMSMCNKNYDENIINIESPSEITIDCKYSYEGFCLYSESGDCDFYHILTQKEAGELNN